MSVWCDMLEPIFPLPCACVFVSKKKFIDIVPFNYLINVQKVKIVKKNLKLKILTVNSLHTHTHITILTTLIFEIWLWFEFPYKCVLCCF